jgi:DNA polymerase-3 subunit delta'
LKVLEEPPTDTVFLLLSARPDDLPDTVRSRCQEVSFPPLSEEFVVGTLVAEGLDEQRARLACRLAGANLGRARRLAADDRQLAAFREDALAAARQASQGPAGALAAAEALAAAAKQFRARLGEELEEDLQPFLDERGRPEEPFRGVVRRLEEQHERRLRRAEREFLDWSLLSLAAYWRDAVLVSTGGDPGLVINLDMDVRSERPGDRTPSSAARAWGEVEEARADLADETNLNARLILERLFLRLSELRPA